MDEKKELYKEDEEIIKFHEKGCYENEDNKWDMEEIKKRAEDLGLLGEGERDEICGRLTEYYIESARSIETKELVHKKIMERLGKYIDDEDVDINETNEKGNNILMQILDDKMYKYMEIFYKLLDKDIDINTQNKNGETALTIAMRNNVEIIKEEDKKMNMDIIKRILKKRINFKARDIDGNTVIMIAVMSSMPKNMLMKLLEKTDVNILKGTDVKKDTLLNISINYNAPEEFIIEVIKRMNNINETDSYGDNGLMTALESTRGLSENVFIELFKKDIDVNSQNYTGRTALMMAIESLFSKNPRYWKTTKNVILEILKRDQNINIQDLTGRTALMYAMWAGQMNPLEYIDIVKNILEKNVDINIVDNNGNTALMDYYFPRAHISSEINDILLRKNIDYTITNNEGRSLIWHINGIKRTRPEEYKKFKDAIIKGRWERVRKIVPKKDFVMKWEKACKDLKSLSREELEKIAENEGIEIYKTKEQICKEIMEKYKYVSKENDIFFELQSLCVNIEKRPLDEFYKIAEREMIDIKYSGREICKKIAEKYRKVREDSDKCINRESILGDDIKTIPDMLLYMIEEKGKTYCFNILELVEQLRKGDNRNPYTRNELPVEEISDKYDGLKQRLINDNLELTNILDQIKNTDIMSEENILSLKVTNLVGLLEYIPHKMIMDLSKEQIKSIFEYMMENPLFMIINRKVNLWNFVDESLRNLKIDDIHKNTRKTALSSYILDVVGEQ